MTKLLLPLGEFLIAFVFLWFLYKFIFYKVFPRSIKNYKDFETTRKNYDQAINEINNGVNNDQSS